MTPTVTLELQSVMSDLEYSWLVPQTHHVQDGILDSAPAESLLPVLLISGNIYPDVQAKSLSVSSIFPLFPSHPVSAPQQLLLAWHPNLTPFHSPHYWLKLPPSLICNLKTASQLPTKCFHSLPPYSLFFLWQLASPYKCDPRYGGSQPSNAFLSQLRMKSKFLMIWPPPPLSPHLLLSLIAWSILATQAFLLLLECVKDPTCFKDDFFPLPGMLSPISSLGLSSNVTSS